MFDTFYLPIRIFRSYLTTLQVQLPWFDNDIRNDKKGCCIPIRNLL
jgi:hypothetical protein